MYLAIDNLHYDLLTAALAYTPMHDGGFIQTCNVDIRNSCFTNKIKKYCDKVLETVSIEELQILSPMKKGLTGTHYLNYLMQNLYNNNPDSNRFLKTKFDIKIDDETKVLELFFRVGDKVINTKNDYQMPWYYIKDGTLYANQQKSGITNGEVGTIVKMIEYRDKYGDLNRKIIGDALTFRLFRSPLAVASVMNVIPLPKRLKSSSPSGIHSLTNVPSPFVVSFIFFNLASSLILLTSGIPVNLPFRIPEKPPA